jgi:Flp pilus assembly protein TadG
LQARTFFHDEAGASAVEFSIVSLPFVLLLLMILQMGIYYMTQSSLDAGIIQAADQLVNSFNTGTAPAMPTAVSLKTLVVSKAGGLIRNDASLSVDLRKLSTLSTAVVPIGSTIDASVARDILVLRAQSSVVTFMPGLSMLAVVRSSALVRRQGQ